MREFNGKRIAVMGGAGFVGSSLIKALLRFSPREIVVIDNLLSAERESVPNRPEVSFVQGSITDDWMKLFERIKSFRNLKTVVYASAGCTVAEKTYDRASATREDAPVSLYLDSPYQISKIIGEMYSNYYFQQHGLPVVKARFQNVYGPGEILGAGQWRGTPATVWRNVTPTFIYRACKHMPLTVENGGAATRDFIYIHDIVRGLLLCATKGLSGEVYNLASGVEISIWNWPR